MPLIVDGYNLLCSCGFVGDRVGPGSLERARGLFLGWLCQVFEPDELAQTTVVFDSVLRMPELPDEYLHQGIRVCFATGHRDADEMIIEMIERDASPKLLIVSSDHQIQNAARRRKCTFEDSDRWFERIVSEKSSSETARKSSQDLKTELTLQKKSNEQTLDEAETQKWLAQFLPAAISTSPTEIAQPKNTGDKNTSEPPKLAKEDQRPSQTPGNTHPQPKASNPKTQRFASTNFGDLAKVKREDEARVQDEKGPKENQRSDNSKTPDDRPSPKVSLDSIEDFYDEVPELNLGQSMSESELKNSMLLPDDIDGWLDDFDQQFLKSKLEIPVDRVRKNPDQPAIDVHKADVHDRGRSDADATEGLADLRDRGATLTPEPAAAPTNSKNQDREKGAVPDGRVIEQSKIQPPANLSTAKTDEAIEIDKRQMDRWNRQLKETDSEIFPPGYAEDILFAETFETDERLKRKRRK